MALVPAGSKGAQDMKFQKKIWLNLPKYPPIQKHAYVKNPFSVDSRSN
jgi:hypothetical protein